MPQSNGKAHFYYSLMRGWEEGREFSHSRPRDGVSAPSYVEVPQDVSHHREIETELRSLGYEFQHQRKRWRVWWYTNYVPAFSPDLHEGDEEADDTPAPNPGRANDGHHPKAAILGDFFAVARRSKAKPRPLALRRSGPSSNVESAHKGRARVRGQQQQQPQRRPSTRGRGPRL